MIKKLEIQLDTKHTIIFGIPETESELEEMFRFRHEVYVKKGYMFSTEEGKDIDNYDKDGKCNYFTAYLNSRIIGTIRIIRDEELPIKKIFFDFEEEKFMKEIGSNQMFEVGRLISIKCPDIFIPRHIVMLSFFKLILAFSFHENLLLGFGSIKKSIKTKLDLIYFPIYKIKKYKQKYFPQEKEDNLFDFFNNSNNPVVPIYYLREDINKYLNIFFDQSKIFKKINQNHYQLKKNNLSFISIVNLIFKYNISKIFPSNSVVSLVSLYTKRIIEYKKIDYSPSHKFQIDLSLTENPLGFSKNIFDVFIQKKEEIENLKHYPSGSKYILATSLAKKFNCECKNVLIERGASGAIELIINTFVDPGDEIVVPAISFPFIDFANTRRGGKTIFSKMKDWQIDFYDIEKIINKNTKIIFICNSNNPTGKVEKKEKIINLVKRVKCLVVVDEANIEYSNHQSVADNINDFSNLIVIRSFSKIYGLAGLRIGYCLSSEDIISYLKRTQTPHSTSSLAQTLAREALLDNNHILASKDFIKKENKYLATHFEKLGFSVVGSDSNYLLVKIDKYFQSSTELIKKLNKFKANAVDGKFFPSVGNKFIRISPSTHNINQKFIEIIKKLINKK